MGANLAAAHDAYASCDTRPAVVAPQLRNVVKPVVPRSKPDGDRRSPPIGGFAGRSRSARAMRLYRAVSLQLVA